MNPQNDDMRNKLFPTYGKMDNPPPLPPPPPTPQPFTPPPPPRPVAQPVQNLGSTFTNTPLYLEDQSIKEFWKMVGLAFLLYITSIAVTTVHIDGKLGALVFILCNPISYFIIALIISFVLGVSHKNKGNAEHSTSSFTFMKAHLSVSVFLGIIALILYLALF